ncbi:hypothetical protein MNBD_UNCLBAC01-234 [hydrothermal vent metagenome]|uniref:CheC-like protein domain-containing protein n=1 Tax=hydrothermal vent metagenome TaxID=652676 RepID=A0A3B1D3A3_9ZZZZ
MVLKLNINKLTELIAQLSVDRASQVLSKMVKSGTQIILERSYVANISEVTEKINAEGGEVMGAFVDLVGDAPFKFLFYTDAQQAVVLTDMILQKKIGTTKEVNIYVNGAIQEIGNILASAVCNVFSTDFQINMKPSPPEVFHDFVGSIFEECIMSVASERKEIFMIESTFYVVKQNIKCSMLILPMPGSEEILTEICNKI